MIFGPHLVASELGVQAVKEINKHLLLLTYAAAHHHMSAHLKRLPLRQKVELPQN